MDENQNKERKFQIEVENQFDYEKRSLTVLHKNRWGNVVGKRDIVFNDQVQQQAPEIYYPREKLHLSPGDILEITIGKSRLQGANGVPEHWYIKLPYVADFIFLHKEDKEIMPTYAIARDVHSGGRTILYFPMDALPTNLKLLVAPPGRIEENYHPEHLKDLKGYIQNDGGGSPDDNVTVGDNGSG